MCHVQVSCFYFLRFVGVLAVGLTAFQMLKGVFSLLLNLRLEFDFCNFMTKDENSPAV